MKFIIVGANFQNKGAQAMLFTTTSELKARFEGCEVLFFTREKPREGYKFKYICDLIGWNYLIRGSHAVRAIMKAVYLMITGNKNVVYNAKKFNKELRSADAFIDISGYALSSQRGLNRSINYLNQIRVAKRINVPYFIMPQSIGPFDYGTQQKKMDKLLKKYLIYPVRIFPREEEGYKILKEKLQLDNIEQSYDLVLQNKGILLENVINDYYKKCVPIFESKNNVAIIPNVRNFDYGSKDGFQVLYSEIIKRLQEHSKTVYLIRHSEEDLDACHMIFESLKDRKGVYLLEDDFDCLQFNGIVKQMDYIIGSRYHGIVHALKNAVPAVVLGWATKYEALLKMFNQERFLFDVRGQIDTTKLLESLDDIESNWQTEKNVISSKLDEYQKDNCFDCISEYFRGHRIANRE